MFKTCVQYIFIIFILTTFFFPSLLLLIPHLVAMSLTRLVYASLGDALFTEAWTTYR